MKLKWKGQIVKVRLIIGEKAVETTIGDGLIRMSYMTPKDLAEHLLESINRAMKEPAVELLEAEIEKIREEGRLPTSDGPEKRAS